MDTHPDFQVSHIPGTCLIGISPINPATTQNSGWVWVECTQSYHDNYESEIELLITLYSVKVNYH